MKPSIKATDFKLKDFNIQINVSRMANIHYFEFTKEYSTSKASHPFKELVYVDSGSIKVDSEGFSGILQSKQLLIHKSNEIHSLSCIGENAPSVIIIGFECDCEKLNIFSTKPFDLSSAHIKILTEIIKEGHSVFLPPYDVPDLKDMKKRKNFQFGADQMLKLKLEMFLIELIRSVEISSYSVTSTVSDKKTEDICAYLNEHYKEKITLDNLCFLFGTNKTTICNNFKNAYGDTIIGYINKLRIKKAKSLMREGDLNLTQLSAATGFSSIHYFSKTFKAIDGHSPSQYIKLIKSKLDI